MNFVVHGLVGERSRVAWDALDALVPGLNHIVVHGGFRYTVVRVEHTCSGGYHQNTDIYLDALDEVAK